MDAQSVRELVEYYTNLIIIQYANRPKAQATIQLLSDTLLANGIIWDVMDGYNVDTAVGVQLDIIGKYVGVDRFFNVTDPVDFFSVTDYVEVDPDSEQKYGFTTYPDFEEDQFNGTMNYNSIVTVENKLNDDDYRVLIKLKIVQNYSNHSHKSIDDSIFEFFGNSLLPSSSGDMKIWYFVTNQLTAIIQAAMIKKVIPRPMGVGMGLIEKQPDIPFFGFITYQQVVDDYESILLTGFTDYDDYATKVGSYLSYRRISVE
jgi:hypothetical protein